MIAGSARNNTGSRDIDADRRYCNFSVLKDAAELLVTMLAAAPALAIELGELLDALGES